MTAIAAIFDRKNNGISRDNLQRVTNALKIYGPQSANTRIIDSTGFCWTHQGGFFRRIDLNGNRLSRGAGRLFFLGTFSNVLNWRPK
jgi:hypothetical protein